MEWGRLPLRVSPNVACRLLDCGPQFGVDLLPRMVEFVLGNPQWLVLAESIPACGVAAYRTIAVLANVNHNPADCRFDFGQIGCTAPGKHGHQTNLFSTFENSHRGFLAALGLLLSALHTSLSHSALNDSALSARLFVSQDNPHHITTLFSGYSTIP